MPSGGADSGRITILRMTITAALEQEVVEKVPKGALINGNWIETGKTLDVIDPSTGEPLCQITDAGEAEALAALDAAANVQAEWAATPPRERSEILRAVYESMVSRLDELALLMTLEMGKPISESKAEVAYAADFLRWFSEEAVRIAGRYSRRLAPASSSRLGTSRPRWPRARSGLRLPPAAPS
jgi:succinate-semialdehyde dehydrogenase/glutarate-semialdehyde dehydrogenase